MRAVLAGPDADGLGDALRAEGVTVTRVEGVPTGERLDAAGIDDAHLYVLTDPSEATSIPVAKERNPDVRAVVYAGESLPEFAQPVTDLTVDPALLGPDAVAEELVADYDE
ncbi:CTP synthetase [Halobaculum sp. MBLA0147]|uniref:DUF7126 family protein n=1 Tax=Halobaculum sp. MBLA0147 TaxID=3079934 RepID=UPI003526AB6C